MCLWPVRMLKRAVCRSSSNKKKIKITALLVACENTLLLYSARSSLTEDCVCLDHPIVRPCAGRCRGLPNGANGV